MRHNKIQLLKQYKSLLFEIKRMQIIQKIDYEVERKIPTYGQSNQKVLVLSRFKKNMS